MEEEEEVMLLANILLTQLRLNMWDPTDWRKLWAKDKQVGASHHHFIDNSTQSLHLGT